VTFSDIAEQDCDMQLPDDQTQASIPKAHSTIATYKRYLARWVLPRWDEQTDLTIQPLELES
jgi:hypothetical protein